MARFKETLDNLQEIARLIPAANRAGKPASKKEDDFAKTLIAILRREDYDSITISLLVNKIISKYEGRAV